MLIPEKLVELRTAKRRWEKAGTEAPINIDYTQYQLVTTERVSTSSRHIGDGNTN